MTNDCVSTCPTGLSGDFCSDVEDAVRIDFGVEGPWTSKGVKADHCHLPMTKPGVAS
jgi:hypothetical protein